MRILFFTLVLFVSLANIASAANGKGDYTKYKETQVSDGPDLTVYSVQSEKVQFYVTKPAHPAYPYMLKNKILGRGLDTRFEITGYGYDSDAAKAFVKEIEDFNAEKTRKIKGE